MEFFTELLKKINELVWGLPSVSYTHLLKGREIIEKYTQYKIPDNEVGYITLHVHSAISTSKTTESIQVMEVIRENIDQLRKDLRITIDENSISYTRLMKDVYKRQLVDFVYF